MPPETQVSERESQLLDGLERARGYLEDVRSGIGAGIIQITPPEGMTLEQCNAMLDERIAELTGTLSQYDRMK